LSSLFKGRDSIEQDLPKFESAVVEARDKAQALDSQLSGLRQRLSDKKNAISAAENRVAFNNERKGELAERLEQNEKDIETTQSNLAEQEQTLQQSQADLQDLEKRIQDKESQARERQDSANGLAQERLEIENQLRRARAEANSTQQIIASSQAKIESALGQMEGNKDRMKQLEEEAERLRNEQIKAVAERDQFEKLLEEHQKTLPGLEEAREKTQREFEEVRGSLDLARKAAAEAHRSYSQKSSRLDVLRQLVESGEGLEKGTQAVLKGLNDPDLIKPGLSGLLGSQLKAPDEYAVAIESALSQFLQAIIVRDEDLADSIIERLVDGKKGSAAILPESFLPVAKASQIEALPEGASAWALDVVTVDSKFAGLMERLLSQVLIVPDRNTALKLRKDYPDLSFVSRNGEVLTPEGVIRGGSSGGKDSSLLKRRNEIEMLVIEVKKLANEEKVAEQEILDCETRTKELREELEQAKDRLQRHRVEDSTFQGQLKLAKREADTIESKVANNKWEREELGSREKTATDSRSALENELTRARERLTALEEDARKFSVRVEEAIKRENEAREQLSEARTALAVEKQARDSAAREQDPMSRRIRELAELNDRRKSEISAARERITKGDGENEELDVEMESYRSEVASLKDELSHADEQRKGFARGIEEAEAGFSEVRSKQNKVLNQISKEEVACTKLDLRLENLVESTMERHQVDLAHFRPDAHILITCINDRKEAEKKGRSRKISEVDSQVNGEEVADEGAEVIAKTNSDEEVDEAVIEILEGEGPDWAFVEAIVADLKRRLDSMGPVNLDAIEEFDELEERHNFTRNQHDDLVNSKEKLLEIIERINIESERLFAETFHAVSKNFKSMFKRLFGDKATADLILQDESDPLECGIEVIAKPPGKKLQSISLMSGGERSMTAVALLFSIYMVKPSPFCVLDELDAPLDESNIGRFLKVLDAFIDQSQFIIVTHSKRTMERADVMYGVTMEEFGVSKPVGMRLTNGVEKPGDAKSSAQKAALRLNS
jgi:chromosome segregation protein